MSNINSLYNINFSGINTLSTPRFVAQTAQTQQPGVSKDRESNMLIKYLDSLSAQNQAKINKIEAPQQSKPQQWNNELKKMFNENRAVIWCINPRTLGAKDQDGNGFIDKNDSFGTFWNGADELPRLKDMGINCIHVLPPHKPGETGALGIFGSLYSPDNFLEVDPMLGGKEGLKYFVDEAHKNGIHVMLDLPSCASLDLFYSQPHLMAFEQNGLAKTPKGWNDIRMFNPWADETNRILNPYLLDMHKKYIDMCIELGIDGVRADVSRAKPTEFWDTLIPYSHQKDPNFGWLAETYTYEDASPQANIPYDRPMDAWRSGFDLIYGQWHIFPEYKNAKEVHDYVIDNLNMSNRMPKGKSLIGSFATHDDVSPMFNGGADYCMETSVLQAFLPMTCPYNIDGFEKGDWYVYPYTQQKINASKSLSDSPDMYVHPGKMDIFNMARPSVGENPEIGEHLKEILKLRKKYINIATHGSYIPLKVDGNNRDQIYAFARHLDGKTLLVIANKDVNLAQGGFIEIPGLKSTQKLKDLCPSYGDKSEFQADENGIKVNLGKARAHVFEIETPNIEISGLNVYRQNLGKIPEN